MYTQVKEIIDQQSASLYTPHLVTSGLLTCLSFNVFYFNQADLKLTVEAFGWKNDTSLTLLTLTYGYEEWTLVHVELPEWTKFVRFQSHAGKRRHCGLGIDDVSIAAERCSGTF